MSNSKDLHLLEKPEGYPQWTIYTLGLLRQKECANAIRPPILITVNAVREELIQSGFMAGQLTVTMLVKVVQNRIEKQKMEHSKAAGIIVNQVAERHQHLIVDKEPHDMWNVLRERLLDVSPLSLTDTLLSMSKKKMADYHTADQYCSEYERVLNETIGMLRKDSQLEAKGIEVIVQGFMMTNTGDRYAPLIAQLPRDWKNGTVNFAETSKAITTYAVSGDKAKALSVKQSSKSNQNRIQTCTTPECLARGRGFYSPEQCWVKHPELRPKHLLQNMKPKGATQTNKDSVSETPKEPVQIDS
ncbi:hypothetical protein MMC07_009003 [Pseudocyphellaria aurata]|nr:hypothetical protein [Pseudocyphellaria aurata]